MSNPSFPSSFIATGQEGSNFPSSFQPIQEEKSPTFKSAATSYVGGLGGGAGGLAGDVIELVEPLANINPLAGQSTNLAKKIGIKNTHELTKGITSDIGGEEPQNSLERILRQSGEFAGQEGTVGTFVGGPVGTAFGLAHGTASGLIYGSLKELGVEDTMALGITTFASLSPIAARKLITKLRSNKEFRAALKQTENQISGKSNTNTPPPPEPTGTPPSGPTSPGIGPGVEIPQVKNVDQLKKDVVNSLSPQVTGKTSEINLPNQKTKAASLKDRVSVEPELARTISKTSFETDAQAGRSISNEIKKLAKEERKPVEKAYQRAREVTNSHVDIYPELAAENERLITELENVQKRNSGQESVYQQSLAIRDLVGDSSGLIEQNASKLIAQADAMSQLANYELPYVGYKGKLKSLVRETNQAVIRSLEKAGRDFSSVQKADKLYSMWADRFLGDEVSGFLEHKILNPESLGRSVVQSEGTYRSAKKALGSKRSDLFKKIDSAVVENRMSKYYKDPSLVNSKEYVQDLKNLSELIGTERTADVDYFLRKKMENFERNKKFIEKRLNKPQEVLKNKLNGEIITKSLEDVKSPIKNIDDLDNVFKSKSKIREIKKKLKEVGKEEVFNALAEEKVKDIFRDGKYGSKKLTGNDIVDTIDKHHVILNELMGEDLVAELYKIGKVAQEKELSEELAIRIAKKVGKGALSLVGLGKILKFLP